jgi:prepilin signal peptidase PulO-like enzyme (type II secretory pathway)
MLILWAIFFGLVGAAGGSFVGALTWRLKVNAELTESLTKGKITRKTYQKRHLSWISGRSVCEHCRRQLAVRDLVPILSWLVLKGKCRQCEKTIGWQAPLLELGLAAAFVISYLCWPYGWQLTGTILFVDWLVMMILLAALLIYDASWRLLPDKIIWPLVGLALIFALINNFLVAGLSVASGFLAILLGLLPVAGVYGLLFLVSKGRWVGLGDVKLGLAIGLLLPWQQGLLVLVGANCLGCLAVLPLLIRRQLKPGSQIPFGPCLVAATFLAMIFGQPIVDFVSKSLFLF